LVFDIKEIPLNAYLNSEADELASNNKTKTIAGEAQGTNGSGQRHPIPHIGNRTITRDLKQTTREIINLIPLK
jgi:hypothetical protein